MRWAALAGEALRNVTSGTALTLPLALVIGVLSAAIVAICGVDVAAIATRGQQYRDSGGHVLVVRAEGAIDASACAALASVGGVRSGALRRAPHDVVAAALPDSSVPTYEVTDGLAGMLAPLSPGGVGVLLSAPAAQTLGGGATLATTDGDIQVGGVYGYPADGRRTDLEFAVLAPTTSSAPFDECWAETWPPSTQLDALLRTTVVQGAGSNVDATLLQLNGTRGSSFDGEALFDARPTRYLPVAAALAGLLVVFAAARLRRIELASARHCGVTLVDQWLVLMIEGVGWMLGLAVLSVPVTAALVTRALPGDASAYLEPGIHTPLLAALGGLTGSTIAVLLSGERHLFRHVKQRR